MKRIIQPAPENRPELSNLKGTPIYADIKTHFAEFFNKMPRLEQIKKSPAVLREDLEERFGDTYDYNQVLQLLEKGHLQDDGIYKNCIYVFKRSDFIPIIKTHFIDETAAAPVQEEEEVEA